jgi:uncharacterized membrane protein YdbT with pleckstrin-like domain
MTESPRKLSTIESWVHAVLRVPPYPEPPEGSADSVQVFRAGRNYYKWCLLVWFASHLLALLGLVAAYLFVSVFLRKLPEWVQILTRVSESFAFLAFAASVIFTFFSQRLNYALRWYIVTDRSLRIRAGVVAMRELTMTFSNIQEIRVTAGPLQNLLKIANVEVQSAGGGGSGKGGGGGHVARFEGVSNANTIRDLMVERLRQYHDSGLGDTSPHPPVTSDQVMDAASRVLTEARQLREHLAK